MKNSSYKPSHLKALLRKNWILCKRSWIITVLEIAVPVLFAAMTIAFRDAAPPKDIPKTSYYDNPSTNILFDGQINLNHIKDCSDEGGGRIALVPQGDDIVAQLESIFCKS